MKSSYLEKLTSKKARLSRLKNKVIDYFSGLPKEDIADDQQKVLAYLKDHDISVFPYPFPNEYRASDIELFRDKELQLYYMLWERKKLYYSSGNRPKKAQQYFNSLRLEQDSRSPHRYLDGNFDVTENDVVVDVGAAEGNFSLSVIEKAGYIYLFEADKNWIKALKATFAPWSHKIEIIPKYVSDRTSDKTIALDDFFDESQTIDFIKADVEGAEAEVLRGARNTIERQKNLKIAICTYHRQEDAEILDAMLRRTGFKSSFSDGYMLYYYGRTNVVKEPFLRRAVLRAVKN
jgi:Methyltransferase FkbM domain